MVLRNLRQQFAVIGTTRLATCGITAVAALCLPLSALAADPKYPTMDAGALMRQADQSRQAAQDRRDLRKLTPLAPPLVLANQQTVSVKGFQFVGVRLMPTEPLQAAVAPFANRALAQADLENIVSAVVDAYRQAGWVVRAYVPNQPLNSDTLTVQILETIPPSPQK